MKLEEFFEEIKNAKKRLDPTNIPLYRGHSQETFKLLPTLQRACITNPNLNTLKLENILFYDFKSLVGPRVKFGNSWEQLYEMRHEGVPTRLLDWTETLGTALYFALESGDCFKPHIWILNPNSLNKDNSKFGTSLINPDVDLEEYSKTYAEKVNKVEINIHDLPIALYPIRSNDRILAQRGFFTIHGMNDMEMEVTCQKHLQKVEIPEHLIDSIRDLLKSFGFNKYSVYPDLKGLSEYLKDLYEY